VRILIVSHNLPPHGNAGTETYAADLARALSVRGHQVAAFAAVKDIRRRDGSVRERSDGGVAIHEVVNNLYHATFAGTWENASVERAFAAVLRAHRPDVVHVQHLMYLSSGCVRLAHESGARVVFTLHDYWLTCARLGQRVHADRSICHEVVFTRCGTCLVDFAWTQPWAARAVGPVIAALHETTGLDLSDTARRVRLRFERGSVSDGTESPPRTASRADDSASIENGAPPPAHAIAAEVRPAIDADDPRARDMAEQARVRWEALRAVVGAHVDLFLSPSRFLRDRFLAEWNLDPARIDLLRFGVDRALFSGARSPSPDGRLRVGFLGTLVPLKGPHVLLEAWSRVPTALRARGRLVLRGPARHGKAYQDQLLDLARRSGAEIPGPLARADVPAFLHATDLLVVPSLWFENSPLTIQEAMVCRTPLCVSDLGGMAELVVPGETGLRFPAGDVAALTEILVSALEGRAGLDRLYAQSTELPTFDEHVEQILSRYVARTPA